MLIKAGDKSSLIYFVVNGKIDISVEINGVEASIDTLYRGCSLGGYCCLDSYPHGIIAEARTPVNTLYLDFEYINSIAQCIPELNDAIQDAKTFVESNSYPMLDFRLYRNNRAV